MLEIVRLVKNMKVPWSIFLLLLPRPSVLCLEICKTANSATLRIAVPRENKPLQTATCRQAGNDTAMLNEPGKRL